MNILETKPINRWVLAVIGAFAYWILRNLVLLCLIHKFGQEALGTWSRLLVNVPFVALWACGWIGNDVGDKEQGIIKFFGKPIKWCTLGKGSNFLPIFFSRETEEVVWNTLNIPETKEEKGFNVTSEDKIPLLCRIGIPWRNCDIVSLRTGYDPEGIIHQLRDTTIAAVREVAGKTPSSKLQTGQEQATFLKAIKPRLRKLMRKYPVDINLDGITIPKFEVPEEVKKAQEKEVQAQGQQKGKRLEFDKSQEMIDVRFAFYKNKGYAAQNALDAARRDVLAELGYVPAEDIRVTGNTARERASAVRARKKPQPKPKQQQEEEAE